MLVANWMTTEVVSLTPDRSMMKAAKLLKDRGISRIPIVDENNKVIGIVSDRDIKDASPSKATTLDMHELYYLLSEIKVQSIMTKRPVTIRQDESVEKAAVLMLEGNFGGLPVVDDDNKLVGIITDSDVFKVLVDITGVREGGRQVCLRIPTAAGSLSPVIEFMRDNGARIMSILTHNVPESDSTKEIYIRIREMEKTKFKQLQADMATKFDVKYWLTDTVRPVI